MSEFYRKKYLNCEKIRGFSEGALEFRKNTAILAENAEVSTVQRGFGERILSFLECTRNLGGRREKLLCRNYRAGRRALRIRSSGE